ncbi:MAG: phosphate/phosphite/phosphonate ABC transporter substrate-binding protein [Gammaproteobacteria bacterium]|nr:phosphate/phosphite/phosphonate ABC transporter substrate-binding protein [Gammaproteobacteria bacterium]
MQVLSRLFPFVLGMLLLGLHATAAAALVVGVHPFKPASKLTEAFTPLINYLSEKLGEPVSLRIAKDYQAHIDALGQDLIDIAYIGPSPYIKLTEQYGPHPLLARQLIGDQPVFHGKIFIRTDSPIQHLAELKGKQFAFGEPHSTMSHLVPRYMLWQAGITVDQLAGYKFIGDHVNVALSVLAGDFDAGAVKEDVYDSYAARGLRAIATSAPISDHLFVASRKLSQTRIRKLRMILLALHKDPQGAAILQSMTPGVKALVSVKDSDYDSLRVVLKKMQELGVDY